MLRNRLLLDITRPSLVKMNFLPTPCNLSIRPTLGVGGEEISNDWAGEWEYSLPRGRSKGFEEGQGAATRDEPLGGRLMAIENQYWDRKAFCFVSLSSFSVLSSFLTETPNTQATVPSPSWKCYHNESSEAQVRRLQRDCLLGRHEPTTNTTLVGFKINIPVNR